MNQESVAYDERSRWIRLALLAFPRRFRDEFARDLDELVRDAGEPLPGLGWNLLRNGLASRWDDVKGFLLGRRSGVPAPQTSGSGGGPLGGLAGDVRYAARLLRKSPGFTLVAVLSLALGIGANTAIFSILDAALLRRLAVDRPEELVVLHWQAAESGTPSISLDGWLTNNAAGRGESSSFSNPFYERLRDAADAPIEGVVGFADLDRVSLRHDGRTMLTGGQVVTGNYYDVLGVRPQVGRLIQPADDVPGAEPVAVLSDGYWRARFAADPSVVGSTIFANGLPFTVVGVSPPGFAGALQLGATIEVSIPRVHHAAVTREEDRLANGEYWWLLLIARAAPGASHEQIQAAADSVLRASMEIDLPAEPDIPSIVVVDGSRGMTEQRGKLANPLFVLAGVIGVVLLIACTNLANLLLARAGSRGREIAVRLSLGAGRFRLVRQLLTESVLLSCIGGVLGLGVALIGYRLLLGVVTGGRQLTLDVGIDGRVLLFTLGMSLGTGVLFGLAPALRASRINLTPSLKDRGVHGAGGRQRLGLSRVLLTVQVGLSLLLLVAAGLFVRTLHNLESCATGFDAENVLLFTTDTTLGDYDDASRVRLFNAALERLQHVPGVRSSGLARYEPVSGKMWSTSLYVEGYEAKDGESRSVALNAIAPGFFRTLSIPVLAGRPILASDDAAAARVAVVNETLARRYFPDGNAIGGHLGFRSDDHAGDYEIVGIVRDVKYQNLRDEQRPTVHLSFQQHPEHLGRMNFALRTAGDPTALAAQARSILADLDPNLPIFDMRTQQDQQDRVVERERAFARLTTWLGIVALVLSCIGLYGILSYQVIRRTQEIGIRMALGARYADVLQLILRELAPVVVGAVLGVTAAFAATRVLTSLLYELSPTDPATIAVATASLVVMATFAAWLPARRAARVDPMIALRDE